MSETNGARHGSAESSYPQWENAPSLEWIEGARDRAVVYVEANGWRPDDVLFAGYRPDAHKPDGGEHAHDDGTHDFYFGDVDSLSPPSETDDEDEAGERLVANPLFYAKDEGTVLGIFDKSALGKYTREVDEEFGTYLVSATPQEVDAARLGSIDLTVPEQG